MKKIIFLFLFILSFSSVSAQRVYKDKIDGKVYLDLSEESGVAPGVATKTPLYAGTFSASNTQYLVDDEYVKRIREEPYYLLEIDKTLTWNKTWSQAFTACKNKGLGWRLPTKSELPLLFIFREGIEDLTGQPIEPSGTSIVLWSASEWVNVGSSGASHASKAFYMRFFQNRYFTELYNYDKAKLGAGIGYRCVREVY